MRVLRCDHFFYGMLLDFLLDIFMIRSEYRLITVVYLKKFAGAPSFPRGENCHNLDEECCRWNVSAGVQTRRFC